MIIYKINVIVAPLAGARIEIISGSDLIKYTSSSLPSRERGLKFKLLVKAITGGLVAPLAGARIEIYLNSA